MYSWRAIFTKVMSGRDLAIPSSTACSVFNEITFYRLYGSEP